MCIHAKVYELYILNVCSLLYLNYTSIKIFLVDFILPGNRTVRRLENQLIFIGGATGLELEAGPTLFLLMELSTCNMNEKVVKMLSCFLPKLTSNQGSLMHDFSVIL